MSIKLRRSVALASLTAALSALHGASAQTKQFTVNADFDSGTTTSTCHGPATKLQCADATADQLVLGRTQVSKANRVWADNYIAGWVIGLDAKTGRQISRFDSALVTINGQATGGQLSVKDAPGNGCDFATKGNCPGRVTTDTNGDVWIINRAFSKQGTLSKFTTDLTHCLDRNNNGKIDTSSDANGDGIVNPDDPAEYFGQNDECILTTIPIGAVGDMPRGVAVDKKGKIWASTWQGQKLYRYNPNEPVALEATVDLTTIPGLGAARPYSMASGKDYIFVSNSSGATIRVHIDTLAVDTAPCGGTYGIVGDPSGQWAWVGGYFQGAVGLFKADFSTTPTKCTQINTGTQITSVTLDDNGVVWASSYNTATVFRISPAGVILGSYPAGANPHGLSTDFTGGVWGIFHASPFIRVWDLNGADLALPQTPTLTAPGAYNYDPYLYSDFTGAQIDRQAPYTRVGSWDAVHDSGVPGLPWKDLAWNTEPEGKTPPETTIKVSVRAADDAATLGTKGYTAATNGAALSGVTGKLVQVKVDMTGPGYDTPVLSNLAIHGPCDTPGEACCLLDSDCTATNLCDDAKCPVPGGKCSHGAKPNCCLTAADCDDKNLCTKDTCPTPGGKCTNAAIAGCCSSSLDCDDGDPCTANLCSGPGGVCSFTPIDGCCKTDLDCTKGNQCSASTCPAPGQLCKIASKPGCCAKDSDCSDGDLCTTDKCDVATKTCAPNTKIAGCCNTDAECNDNDPCTADTCSSKGGLCKHTTIAECCTQGSPDVGQPCSVPKSPNDQPPCKAGKKACTNGKFTCEGAVGPTTEICDGLDNDCNGQVDGALSCPTGQACKSGYCAAPCQSGEFACPTGLVCADGLCLPEKCAKVDCPAGKVCDAKTGDCVTPTGGTGGSGGSAGAGGSAGKAGSAGAGASGGSAGAGAKAGAGGAAGAGAAAGTAGAAGKAGGAAQAGSAGAGATAGTTAATGGKAGGGSTAAPAAEEKGGCGCEVPGRHDDPQPGRAVALGALAAVVLVRRRRAGGAK